MQPYLYPYLPYFALLALADTFVIYDCVQFPRRGRIHRSEIAREAGVSTWLTLPLRHQPQSTLIKDLAFADLATEQFRRRLANCIRRTPVLARLPGEIAEHLHSELTDVVDFLEQGLRAVAGYLGLEPSIVRSSALGIDPSLRSADRIIAISKTLGAKVYVNASGGRSLYDGKQFAAANLQLEFLPTYEGQNRYLLPALARSNTSELRNEILAIASARETS